MASLVCRNFPRNISKYAPSLAKALQIRWISTSKKNRDTATITNEDKENTVCDVNTKKNWMSYGFSDTDYDEDRFFTHVTVFSGITLVFCFGGFVLVYRPDDVGRDWAQREAYLELRRREKLNIPLIDRDYIPESKIILPSDEELGDTEIVV